MLLRVMTYNILDGGVGREQEILQILKENQPDIAVLQEVFQTEFAKELAQTLGMQLFFAKGNTKRHLALLSRFPIIAPNSHHPFPPIQRTILEAEIEVVANQRVKILGIHLVPFPSVLLELWRLWEVGVITHRARLGSPAQIVLGDFNAFALNDAVLIEQMPPSLRLMLFLQLNRGYTFAISAVLKAGLIDCFRQLHPKEAGFTLPTGKPNARLDYVFASQPMAERLRKCFVVQQPATVTRASDHYPLMAEFEF